MNRSDHTEKRGRGTGFPALSPLTEILIGEGKDIITRERENGQFPRPPSPSGSRLDDTPEALAAFLAGDPARSVRDFKGKGFTQYRPFDPTFALASEVPFEKLSRAEVRRLATADHARFLPRNVRQAAGRDPGLVWDERCRRYRLRSEGPPAPTSPSGGPV